MAIENPLPSVQCFFTPWNVFSKPHIDNMSLKKINKKDVTGRILWKPSFSMYLMTWVQAFFKSRLNSSVAWRVTGLLQY